MEDFLSAHKNIFEDALSNFLTCLDDAEQPIADACR